MLGGKVGEKKVEGREGGGEGEKALKEISLILWKYHFYNFVIVFEVIFHSVVASIACIWPEKYT